MNRRPYEELQRIVEQEGGRIVCERAGQPKGDASGATLQGNQKAFRLQGPAEFPPMDQLYVPKVQSPVHYSDYSRTLIPSARENYASRNGAPLVVITNADAYEIYDRRAGLDHTSMLQANFRLTAFRETDLLGFDLLRP